MQSIDFKEHQNKMIQAAKNADKIQLQRLASALAHKELRKEFAYPTLLQKLCDFGHFSSATRLLEANSSLKRFEIDEVVEDELIPFFNQEGNWVGLGAGGPEFGKIQNSKIPKERTIQKQYAKNKLLKEKPILLSSFTSTDTEEKPIELPYSKIAGDLQIEYATRVYCPNLKEVGGDIIVTNASSLLAPKLQYLGGDIQAQNATEVVIPDIEKILGYLSIDSVQEFEAQKLKLIGGSLNVQNCENLCLPKIERIGQDLIGPNIAEIKTPKLKHLGEKLLLPRKVFKKLKRSTLNSLLKTTKDKETQKIISKEIQEKEKLGGILNSGESLTLIP